MSAQNIAGEYFVTGSQGEIVLNFQYTAGNQVTGNMVDMNGGEYQLSGVEEAGVVSGTINSANGSSYFQASRQGNQLQFSIIPPDQSGQPNMAGAQSFAMNAREGGNGGNTEPVPPSPTPMTEQPPAGKTGGGIFGPLSKKPNLGTTNGDGGGELAGTYQGNLNGTPTTLNLQQTGNQISGIIDAEGYKYQLQGTATGSQGQGTLTDPQTGGTMQFVLQKQGGTINMNLSAQGQQLQLTFSEGGAGNGGGGLGGANNSTRNPNFQYDPQLIGNWINSQSYTSGEFSAATQTRLIIQGDGTYLYGDGKVAGGTGSVSGTSGGGGMVKGQWRTENRIIYINEGTGWVPFARYYVEGNSLMFTFNDNSKQIWKR